jgi:hypothetical protein
MRLTTSSAQPVILDTGGVRDGGIERQLLTSPLRDVATWPACCGVLGAHWLVALSRLAAPARQTLRQEDRRAVQLDAGVAQLTQRVGGAFRRDAGVELDGTPILLS